MDKILIWNTRRLSRRSKQVEVRNFILSSNVKLFCLLETRVKNTNLGDMYLCLCLNWCFTSNHSHHKSGRIVLAWQPDNFTVNLLHSSDQYIHCQITVVDGNTCIYTFMYAHNEEKDRKILWEDLKAIADSADDPWVIRGDVNALMNVNERIGAKVKEHEVAPIRNCMIQCGLEEVKTCGQFFTWSNKQLGDKRVVPRVLGNSKWFDKYPNVEAHFLPEGAFDHSPMILQNMTCSGGRKPFKIFNHWVEHPHFHEEVEKAWNVEIKGQKMFRVLQKLKTVKQALKNLNKNGATVLQNEDSRQYNQLLEVQGKLSGCPRDENLINLEKETREQYQITHRKLLSEINQKAKVRWIQQGDESSAVFYQT